MRPEQPFGGCGAVWPDPWPLGAWPCYRGEPGAGGAEQNAQPHGAAGPAVAASACVRTVLPSHDVLLVSLPTPSHSPLGWQAGGCFGCGLLRPQVLSWRRALIFASPPMPCPFGHVSFLLTWHHCRPVLLGASLGLVPRKKHFQQPWWPLPQSSYWTVLRGLLTYPQVSRGKVNVLLYFWCWTGGIRHPKMMITSVFVSID